MNNEQLEVGDLLTTRDLSTTQRTGDKHTTYGIILSVYNYETEVHWFRSNNPRFAGSLAEQGFTTKYPPDYDSMLKTMRESATNKP